jgi:Sulfotransferase family
VPTEPPGPGPRVGPVSPESSEASPRRERLISRPLLAVGAPRSGTTVLHQALSTHPDLWSLYDEGHTQIPAHLRDRVTTSYLIEGPVDDVTAAAIEREYFEGVGNLEALTLGPWISRAVPFRYRIGVRVNPAMRKLGRRRKVPPIRMVDVTPDNAFRLQPLKSVFPDAQFLFIVRDPKGSIASMYHDWKVEGRSMGYDLPPGFHIRDHEGTWLYGIPPHWEDLNGASLIEVCAFQWVAYNEYCLRDLPDDASRMMIVRYEEYTSNPGQTFRAIAEWADLDPKPFHRFDEKLPVVNTRSKPSSEKWRRYASELASVADQIGPMSQRLGYDGRVGGTSSADAVEG